MASQSHQSTTIVPPVFSTGGAPPMSASTAAAVSAKGTPATLNLDELFSDYYFTADGDMIFPSEEPESAQQNIISSNETQPSLIASRPAAAAVNNGFVQVPYAGGINTTGLHQSHGKTTAMGPIAAPVTAAPSAMNPNPVPFQQPPQQKHHLPFATTNTPTQKPQQRSQTTKRKPGPSGERKMSAQQKSERR